MAVSEQDLHRTVTTGRRDRGAIGTGRGHSWARIMLLPVGATVVAVGLAATSLHDGLQWPIALAGLLLALSGIDAAGKRIWGLGWQTSFWLACAWMAIVVLAAAFADVLPLAESQHVSRALQAPVLKRPDLLSTHPLGTDNQGLDILGGVVYGARVSLQVSFGAVAIGLLVGGLVGVSAGYFRGRFDAAVGLLTDSLLAFPPLILLLAVMTAVEPNARNVAFALALLTIPTFIRLARANTLTYAQREFVLAARAMGASRRRVVLRELVPNVIRPLTSYGFIIVAVLIVAEASLSFLGVGIQRPTPTWGNMIQAGQDRLQQHPHTVFIPGAFMFLTVFAVNRIGDEMRRLWDPRESRL